MNSIFNMDGPIMKAMRDLMSLVILNVLTLLCSVPIVTAGASLAAMHYVLYQIVDGTEGHIAAAFWKQFRLNLRNATPIWLVLVLSAVFLYLEYFMFSGREGASRVVVITVFLAVFLLLLLSVWLFPLTAKFVYSTSGCFRNALILSVSKLPRTILMAVIMVVIPFILTQDMRFLPLAFVIGISLPGYLCALLYHSVIDDMIQKQLEKTSGKAVPEDEENHQ